MERIRRKVETGEVLTGPELDRLRAAAQVQPGPTLRLTVAHALINAGEERTALSMLERIVRDFPRDLQAWLGLARAQLGLDRKAEAERSLEAALALSPGDPEALKVMAMLAMQRGEFARARQLVEDVLRRDPFDDEAKLVRAELEAADLNVAPPPPPAAKSVALRPQFVRELLRVLRGRGVGAVAKGDTLFIQPKGAEPARAHLGSLYAAYLAGDRPLEEAVRALADNVIAAALGVPADPSALLRSVLPVLRPASFLQVAPGAAHREGPAGLFIFYVVDDPELVRYVPQGSLAARAIDAAALDEAAFRNLAAKGAPMQRVRIDRGGLKPADRSSGLLALAAQDGHDPARLLLPSVREHIARELGPPPWRVDLGRREVALVCRHQDADACAALDAFSPEPDGIAGPFRVQEDGALVAVT
ncbi:MAG: tetratricopeptide repeat protein [Myxococcaceae bacterium]|nr:tetratricopeptide repeat protein [Myxococcaceae bacterium]